MHVYCDMDGVLVDLIKGYVNVAGVCLTTLHGVGDSKWNPALEVDGFWKNLPPMEDHNDLLNFFEAHIPGHKLHVLSAPQHLFPTCADEKAEWIRKHATVFNPDNINVVDRKRKPEFALRECGGPNILIDDYEKNIREWTEAGGIGIHHTSAETTINRLRELI